MKVEVNDKFKFACVWLTKEEKNNEKIKINLDALIQEYKEKKYKFVIFESGEKDLLELTKSLLSHNKNLVTSKLEGE